MSFVHLHLLLNHIPTVGTIIALALLLFALAKKNDDVKSVSLTLFVTIALISLPTYMTGYSAQEAIEDRPDLSAALVEKHQSAALLALMLMEVTGVVAWFGLWQARKPTRRAGWNAPVVLLLSVVTIGLMAGAANVGGQITHPEIVSPGEAPARVLAPAMLQSAYIGRSLSGPWAWPTLEAMHFVGLCLLFGVALVGNLRILGLMRISRFEDIHRLLPWGLFGFVINSVTGMLFFVGNASQYIENPAFHYKVVFMLIAGANVLYLTLVDDIWTLARGEKAPLSARLMAGSQVFLWVGVIFLGRMLPYFGNPF